jgi:hypothetical protein
MIAAFLILGLGALTFLLFTLAAFLTDWVDEWLNL